MDDDTSLDELRNEVLRKIGRNVVLFQELERILKFLVAVQRSSAPASQLKAHYEQRLADTHRLSLGLIARRLNDGLYASADEGSAAPDQITEPWLSLSFGLEADAAFATSSKNSLDSAIEERNELIHHLLPKWDLKCFESCKSMSDHLDDQRKRVLLEIDKYKNLKDGLKEIGKELQEFMDSEAGRKLFDLSFLQQSQLVSLLGEIASQNARQDGWTLLSTAGALLRLRVPEEFEALKARYGHGSLLKLIAATELFDVQSEQTQKGGVRTLYRFRDRKDVLG